MPIPKSTTLVFLLIFGLFRVACASGENGPSELDKDKIAELLKAGYPDFVAGIDGNDVVFKDGSRLPFDDKRVKTFDEWLSEPDIEDMFRLPYPRGAAAGPPARDFDPGRARNREFFTKIYGDCGSAGFAKSLTTIAWLPKRSAQLLKVTTINGVAQKLKVVSDELDQLPRSYDAYLVPSAGTFICRTIAGTDRRSAHGYGIAIDIAVQRSHYWRWGKGGASGAPVYRNDIPPEIVDIFERHGFIWGGRWYHYDTMHFEYRPELLGR